MPAILYAIVCHAILYQLRYRVPAVQIITASVYPFVSEYVSPAAQNNHVKSRLAPAMVCLITHSPTGDSPLCRCTFHAAKVVRAPCCASPPLDGPCSVSLCQRRLLSIHYPGEPVTIGHPDGVRLYQRFMALRTSVHRCGRRSWLCATVMIDHGPEGDHTCKQQGIVLGDATGRPGIPPRRECS